MGPPIYSRVNSITKLYFESCNIPRKQITQGAVNAVRLELYNILIGDLTWMRPARPFPTNAMFTRTLTGSSHFAQHSTAFNRTLDSTEDVSVRCGPFLFTRESHSYHPLCSSSRFCPKSLIQLDALSRQCAIPQSQHVVGPGFRLQSEARFAGRLGHLPAMILFNSSLLKDQKSTSLHYSGFSDGSGGRPAGVCSPLARAL